MLTCSIDSLGRSRKKIRNRIKQVPIKGNRLKNLHLNNVSPF